VTQRSAGLREGSYREKPLAAIHGSFSRGIKYEEQSCVNDTARSHVRGDQNWHFGPRSVAILSKICYFGILSMKCRLTKKSDGMKSLENTKKNIL
jgi:hypothetical protein